MMRRTFISSAVAALSCIALSAEAHAAAVDCAGKISAAYTTKSGRVTVFSSWRNNWTQICNLNTEWKGVPTQTCWGWYAKVNTAVAEALEIRFHFADGTSATCDQLLTFHNAKPPEYVMLRNP